LRPDPGGRAGLAWCVDFGSTFTKAALVDIGSARLVGTGSHRTTIDSDVLDGWDAIRASVPEGSDPSIPVLACSSAGGGLRIAVVGNEELVTSEAGRRVALSSGGKVVGVTWSHVDLDELHGYEPDVVLLVGGTDGGNAEVLLSNARALASARWSSPIVVAGNEHAAEDVSAAFDAADLMYVVADNVVPEIGVLHPASARAAIREVFLSHVIGGKHLSSRADFTAMVRGATPDVVLTAVELLAGGLSPDEPGAGDVVVVDIGGATTDVHSVVEIAAEESGLAREVVATVPVSRTVEGDLGMRWSAVSTVDAAADAGLEGAARLHEAAEARRADPSLVPRTRAEARDDLALASAAATLAVRRHSGRQQVVFSPDGRLIERTGKDLREVGLLVGSGGVLRHNSTADALRVLGTATGDHVEGGWLVPRDPRVVIDHDYVLAAAGLLAREHPHAAHALLTTLREPVSG
jgi:uncharacterized protein (TIGR01319 family)